MPAILAISSSVSSRCTRSISVPILRASMNSVSPRRSRKRPLRSLVAREKPQADRNLRRVEELARQRHHAVHEIGLDDGFANLALARLVGRHRAVGEHEAREPGGRQVIDEVLHPGEVGVARGRHAVDPALVVLEQFAAPVAVVERRVGEHIVGLEVGVRVVVEGVAVTDLCVDAADGEVHLGQPPGGVVRLLAVDGDVAELAAVRLDELLAAARTCRPSRSRGRRRGPCRARASRPARAPPGRACRTGRPSCPRRWRTATRKYS